LFSIIVSKWNAYLLSFSKFKYSFIGELLLKKLPDLDVEFTDGLLDNLK